MKGCRVTTKILVGDALAVLKTLPSESVNCCITSPPYYGLRNYGVDGQIGLETTPEKYIAKLVEVFREVRRVLRSDGILWANIGDSYASGKGTCHNPGGNTSSFNVHLKEANVHPLDRGNKSTLAAIGLKPKDLIGIPWMLAFALRADGWYLRSDIIWAKSNCMPESVLDRPTRSHEYIFLLSKSSKYYYDHEAIKEPAIYDVDGTGTASRKARASTEHKAMPTAQKAGIRPAGFKDATAANGKHGSTLSGGMHGSHFLGDAIPEKERREDKQRGHSRRHAGFNDRWDAMTKEEQCVGMRNKRDVWTAPTSAYTEAHFATFNPKLIEPCVLAGCPEGGTVLDPFFGAGTTGLVADRLNRNCIGIELNPAYADLARNRIKDESPMFAEVEIEYPPAPCRPSQNEGIRETPAGGTANPCEALL